MDNDHNEPFARINFNSLMSYCGLASKRFSLTVLFYLLHYSYLVTQIFLILLCSIFIDLLYIFHSEIFILVVVQCVSPE